VLNPETKYVYKYREFLDFKKVSNLCTFSDVERIKLDYRETVRDHSVDINFFLKLTIFSGRSLDFESPVIAAVNMRSRNNTDVFNYEVAIARNKALEIATITGCYLEYNLLIPGKEWLQPSAGENILES